MKVMHDQVESGFLQVLGVFGANDLGYPIDIQGRLGEVWYLDPQENA